MAEQAKRMLLAKGHCGTCQSPVSVEVPEPAPVIQTKAEPCRCGKTEGERTARWAALGIMSLFFCILGCCSSNHYFTTQQIKAIAEKYQVRKATMNDKPFFNSPEFVVEEKPAPPKEEKK